MFHVFVEGPADESPDGIARLAEAIANHYGLPVDGLRERLDAGRFRVKGNVDRETADTYVRDLERLGARCSLEAAETSPSRATPLPFPAVRPATPPAGLPVARPPLADQPPSRPSAPPSALAGQAPSRPSAPPSALANMPRPSTPPPVAGAYTSGLSAAFGSEAQAGLGALEREDVTFSLASVDGGSSDEAAIEKSPEPMFAPPPPKEPAAAAAAPKKAKPKDEPVDMFAPPDAESAEMKVDLADDEQEFARKRVSTPPANVPVVRASSPAIGAQAPVTAVKSKLGPLADERVRMIAGALLAVLLGFLPAHLYARSREKTAYAELDQKLQSIQIAADTPDAFSALDQTRASFLERKHEERRNIAMIALAIWALVGGGIAYGWFRRVPWDDMA